jgi:hypothetical protein
MVMVIFITPMSSQPSMARPRSFSPGGETTARFQRCHLAISVLKKSKEIDKIHLTLPSGKLT